MDQQTIQPRQIAYIVKINDLISGRFVKEEGWNPNYVVIGEKHVSRVNIIGAIIDVNDNNGIRNVSIDDGTGKISIREFDKKTDVAVGEVVLLIGRVRRYGNEIYLTPEIIKKNINRKWSLVWKKLTLQNTGKEQIEEKEENIIEKKIEEEHPKTISFVEQVLEKIKELDSGDGANYQEIVKFAKEEKIISNLLLQGDIFEIKPGKLKVLD